MYKFIVIILLVLFTGACGSSRKSESSKRSMMVLDQHRDLPKNAKFNSPRYQQKRKKSQKKFRKANKRTYKRNK